MKLIHHIMLRVSISIAVVMAVWTVLFYFTIVGEVQDETDDLLEDNSAMIMQKFLAGETIPEEGNGTNSSYFMRRVAADSLAIVRQREGFTDEKIFVKYKNETEPARVLRQIFRDRDDNYFEVTVITPTIDQSDLLEAMLRSLVILFVILLVVILFINSLAVRGGLRPLDELLAWLRASNVENSPSLPIFKGNIREIESLSLGLHDFASRGHRAFELQKEFIGNASHELQTPIAVCQNRLELLCESGLTESQMEDVAGCLSTLSRLSKLNKSLLMLSRIDNGGFEVQEVLLADIVQHNAAIFEEIYAHAGITLTFDERAECRLQANKELISTLVVNLIKNSYSYNCPEGEVRITLDRCSLRVENSAQGGALDSERIFSRFYQEGTKVGSAGLGLSIVHSICKLYGYYIAYSFGDAMHRFEVRFK